MAKSGSRFQWNKTMSDKPITSNNSLLYEDEISISELLMKLWAKRGLIVFTPLLFAGLVLAALLVGKISQQSTVSYYIELNGISLANDQSDGDDNDDDADENDNVGNDSGNDDEVTTRYPNGTIFSPQDLINPSVIRVLAERTGLDAFDLSENVNVQFGTPVSRGVLVEYKSALAANSKASAEDLAALNSHYADKINAVAKRGLKITVDYAKLGLTQNDGVQVAELIPKLWNKVYTEQFITLLPSKLLGLRWTNDLHDLTTPIGLQEASTQIDAIEQGVDEIAADGRLVNLLNVNGVSATDIKTYLGKFREIYFLGCANI